jgi:hypothetical protein
MRGTVVLLVLLVAVLMFEVLALRNRVANVSAVGTSGSIGVYWDASCTGKVYSIDWGVLTLGEAKSVVVYARNEGSETVFLSVTTSNFVPTRVSDYLIFVLTCAGHKARANQIVKATLSLSVSPRATGNSTFSFDLIFEGKTYVVGDLNGDGVVNMYDALLFSAAYDLRPEDSGWNADADLNENGVVDVFDALLFSKLMSS